MTSQELKAMAYDTLAQIEQLRNQLTAVNKEIEKAVDAESAKLAPSAEPETTPAAETPAQSEAQTA